MNKVEMKDSYVCFIKRKRKKRWSKNYNIQCHSIN